MGGLKYQQGMESARQQEARNILNALGKEQNIQAALDKRKANNQLEISNSSDDSGREWTGRIDWQRQNQNLTCRSIEPRQVQRHQLKF